MSTALISTFRTVFHESSWYDASFSLKPLILGLKRTTNGSGCASAPSLIAIVSIGCLGSSEISNAHRTSAVLMKSDLSARCCPGQILRKR